MNTACSAEEDKHEIESCTAGGQVYPCEVSGIANARLYRNTNLEIVY